MSPDDPGTGTPAPSGSSDAELLAAVRGRAADAASTAAFGALYDRHHDAARALARQLARSPADTEDLVSAAFARMLEVLRNGGGPTEAFRAYLLTSVRHLAYDRSRAERRLDLTEDIGDVVGVDPERTVVPFSDTAVAGLERSLAARAFATLPERWQAVLWHLEVEGDSPATVAPLFGLSPNAVSALGYRAREGLRQAYLQEHLASEATDSPPRDRRHRETEERLGAYTRGGLSQRDATRVEAHLAECEECRALAAELREVNSGIVRAAVGPTVLGAALVGYLATRGVDTGGFPARALPTTGELVVAGGGALGVLGALGGALRPGTLLPGALARATSPAGVLTVSLVGVGLAAAGLVGAGAVGTGPSGLGPFGVGPLGPDPVGPVAPAWPGGGPLAAARPGLPPGPGSPAPGTGGAGAGAGGGAGGADGPGRAGSDGGSSGGAGAATVVADRTPDRTVRARGAGRADPGSGPSVRPGRPRPPGTGLPGSSAGGGTLDPGSGRGGTGGSVGVVQGGSGARQGTTGNRQRSTGTQQRGTGDRQGGTGNRQRGTGARQGGAGWRAVEPVLDGVLR